MKKTVWTSKYFFGNKVSDYGLENGYVDYHTLAKSFDAVLVNDITKLFYTDINGEYSEPEQENGFIDNSEEIEELQEELENIESELCEMIEADEENTPRYKELEEKEEKIKEQIEDLDEEQCNQEQEVFQWFIIDGNGASILEEYTDEIVYYLPVLGCYVWGVTHWGTSWDYVLTDIKIELEKEED